MRRGVRQGCSACPAASLRTSQALWLAGDAIERPGLLGLARCARLDPNGDVIRFVYRMGTGKPHLEPSAMVAAAAQLDLVSNVFQDGQHGTLGFTRLEARVLPAGFAVAAPQYFV